MENTNNEFNLDEELKDVRERREKQEAQKREELYDYLSKLKIKRMKQTGIAVGLAAIITVGGIIAFNNKKNPTPTTDYAITSEMDDSFTLTRNYTVKFGDTISGIASETGISQSRIVNDNNLTNANMIDINQRLILNYKINPEDLEYYTQTIIVSGESLATIANLYETNTQTLLSLNEGAIVQNDDGTYTIVSNTLTVPNFITARELRDLKGSQK